MASDGEQFGCAIGALVVIGGGWWLFNNYEFRKREPEPPVPVITTTPVAPKLPRPSGDIELTTSTSGSRWVLDADSVSGTRKARQGWVNIDASKDKTANYRTEKTLYLVDCETTAARILSDMNYGTDGKPIYSESHDPKDAKVIYYPPDTLAGGVVRRICNVDFDR